MLRCNSSEEGNAGGCWGGGDFLCCPQRSGWTPVSSVGLQPSTFSSSSSSDSCFCFVSWTCSLTFIAKYHINHMKYDLLKKKSVTYMGYVSERYTLHCSFWHYKHSRRLFFMLSKRRQLHPWCSTAVLVGAKHLHVAPKLQSAATPVDQSPYQMSQSVTAALQCCL